MIGIAHSPDLDDELMFWALKRGLIDTDGLDFEFEALDTEALNESAIRSRFDVVAVSAVLLSRIWKTHLVLSHGASIGRAYGPCIVAKAKLEVSELNSKIVAIPGESTTAGALLRMLAPKVQTLVVAIRPHELVFEALEEGRVDAALLIHEGQLTYEERGLELVLDLGTWWHETKHLPLPLGVNVIRRAIEPTIRKRVSLAIRKSILYGMENRKAVLEELVSPSSASPSVLSGTKAMRYLDMFVNEDTLSLTPELKTALSLLVGHMNPEACIRYEQ